jgi:hypothetical protein
MITQNELDEASCILSEVRAVTDALMAANERDDTACGLFAALSRLITSAKQIIDGEVRA